MIDIKSSTFPAAAVFFEEIVFNWQQFWATGASGSALGGSTMKAAAKGVGLVIERMIVGGDGIGACNRGTVDVFVAGLLLLGIETILCGVTGRLGSLFLCNVFSSEGSDSFKISRDLVIELTNFCEPVFEKNDVRDACFFYGTKSSNLVGKITRHVDFKFCTESSVIETRGSANEKIVSLHNPVRKVREGFGGSHL